MALALMATVGLDGSGFEAGMKRIEGAGERVAHTLKHLALEAFGVYSVANAVTKTVEYADKLVDTSRRLGVGIEALQELGYAARVNGADLEQLTSFIEKLNSARIDPKKFPSFEKLGIANAGSLPVEDLLLRLNVAIKNRSSQEVIGPLRDIGGKGAGAMIPMLKDDLEELSKEAHRAGIITAQSAVELKYLSDEMVMLKQTILAQLAPAISFAMEKFLRFSNLLRAAGTFWGDFFASLHEKKFWSNLLMPAPWGRSLTGGEQTSPKELWQQFKASLMGAGGVFAEELAALNGDTDKRLAALLKKQKDIEDANRVPDFDSVMKEGKEHHKKPPQLYTDSLLRIGNFLGAGQTPMERIAQEHTHLLRQIATNTRSLRHKGSGTTNSGFGHL